MSSSVSRAHDRAAFTETVFTTVPKWTQQSLRQLMEKKQECSPSIQGDIIWRLAVSGAAELFIEICFVNSATRIPLDQETLRYPDMALQSTYNCYPSLSPTEVGS